MSDPGVGRSTVGYLLAVGLLSLALGWVLTSGATSLAPAVRGLLLALLVATLLVLGLAVEAGVLVSRVERHRRVAARGTYAIALLAHLALLWYATATYDLGPGVGALLAIWFLLLARLFVRSFNRGTRVATPRASRVALSVLVLSGVALAGYDATAPGVETTATTYDRASIDLVEIGTEDGTVVRSAPLVRLDHRNEFPFARHVDAPAYDACVAGDDAGAVRNVSVYDAGSRLVDGRFTGTGAARTYVRATLRLRADPGESIALDVERGSSCDADRERPTLSFWRERAT